MFYMCGARKWRYLTFKNLKIMIIRLECPVTRVKPGGSHCLTVSNIITNMLHITQNLFLMSALYTRGTLCKSLATLQELVQDPSSVMVLKCELAFLAEKADRMLILTDVLQSRKPCTLKVCDVLEDLQLDLTCHESLTRES